MKKHTLSFGVAATHESISSLGSFNDAISISDFDAFVFDPLAFQQHGGIPQETHARRQIESHDLVTIKGGIILCLVRPRARIGFTTGGGADMRSPASSRKPKVRDRGDA